MENAERSPNFYFTDGNIILIADNSTFRVHASFLARHSRIFNDLLQLPQPSTSTDSDILDGCPIVHLSDTKEDIECLLSIFYDGLVNPYSSSSSKALPFETVSAMLRLGFKYDIEFIRAEAILRLEKCFPSTFEAYDKLRRSGHYNAKSDAEFLISDPILLRKTDAMEVLKLARQFDLDSLIPLACYVCAQISIEELGESFSDGLITYCDLMRCITGREKFIRTNIDSYSMIFTLIQTTQDTQEDECESACSKNIIQAQSRILGYLSLSPDLLRTYEDFFLGHVEDAGICERCEALTLRLKDLVHSDMDTMIAVQR
ncbi:hypothetical protein ABKN59_009639 [Abortiporus biennis]